MAEITKTSEPAEKFNQGNASTKSTQSNANNSVGETEQSVERLSVASHSKASKTNVSSGNKRNIAEKETFHRINYLLQAAQLVSARSPKSKGVPSYYCSLIHNIAQKSLIRLHPDVKRLMCHGCKSLLFPGINAQTTVKSKPEGLVMWKCLLCGSRRKLPSKRGYKLWVQKPDAIVQ